MKTRALLSLLLALLMSLSSCQAFWDFLFPSDNGPPTSPALIGPADGAVGVSRTPTLSWEDATDPDDDPVTYVLCCGTGDPPAPMATLTATSYAPASPLAGSTLYAWKVIAKDGNGGETESASWSFTTEAAPAFPQDFTAMSRSALTAAGWVFVIGPGSSVEVIDDPTGSGHGAVLELSDPTTGTGDHGAVAYSPAVPALTTANLTVADARVDVTLDFYLASDVPGRWFLLGKTSAESFVMNDPSSSVDAYASGGHSYITVSSDTWYTLEIAFNVTVDLYDITVRNGATVVGTITGKSFDTENYDFEHFTAPASSDGRLMLGSWFSYAACPDTSYGHAYIDNVSVVSH
jgi:hypothetical protein